MASVRTALMNLSKHYLALPLHPCVSPIGTVNVGNRAKDSLREGVDQEYVPTREGAEKSKDKAEEHAHESKEKAKGAVKGAWESAKDAARKITNSDDDAREKEMDEDVVDLRRRAQGDRSLGRKSIDFHSK